MAGSEVGVGRRVVPVPYLIAPIVAISLLGLVGDAIGPRLITTHPALQIFLSPKNRYFILAAPQLDAWTFFAVGFVRLVLTDPLFFLLGYHHGDAALRWAEEKLGESGRLVRTAERWFRKAAPVVILVAPTSYLNLLAGATGMRVSLYVVLNVVGTGGRLAIFWFAGEWFERDILSVLDWVRSYQWWLVGASVLVVALQVWRGRDTGILDNPIEIAEEIEELGEELAQAPGGDVAGEHGAGQDEEQAPAPAGDRPDHGGGGERA